jgi:translation initiation factor IF-3
LAHQHLGRVLLVRVAEDTIDAGKVENFPKMEGRQMVMLIGPLPK